MPKKNLNPTLYCTCGHDETFHADYLGGLGRCAWSDGDIGGWCLCTEFRLDNLLYLEELNKLNGLEHYND